MRALELFEPVFVLASSRFYVLEGELAFRLGVGEDGAGRGGGIEKCFRGVQAGGSFLRSKETHGWL